MMRRFAALLLASLLAVPPAVAVAEMHAERTERLLERGTVEVLQWSRIDVEAEPEPIFRIRAPAEPNELLRIDADQSAFHVLLFTVRAEAPAVVLATVEPETQRAHVNSTVESIFRRMVALSSDPEPDPQEGPQEEYPLSDVSFIIDPEAAQGLSQPPQVLSLDPSIEFTFSLSEERVVLLEAPPAAPCSTQATAALVPSCHRGGGRKRGEAAFAQALVPGDMEGVWGPLLILVALALLMLAAGISWGLLAPLFTRFAKSDILDHPRRSRIYECLLAEPGLGFGEIAARLGIPNGALQHHVALLQKQGLICRYRDGRSTRFYPCGARLPASATLSGTREAILRGLSESGPMTAPMIAARLGHRSQSVWHHLRLLEARGLLVGEKVGNAIYWRVPPLAQA